MKWIISTFLASIIIMSMNMSISREHSEYPTPASKEVDIVLNKSARQIENNFPIITCGRGVAMPEGDLKKLSLSFKTKEVMTTDQLRKLLLKTSQCLLENIKTSKINEFLPNNVFTIESVQIIIFNFDSSGRESYFPNIATAQISHGMLSFSTLDNPKNYDLTDQLVETYERAVELVSREESN